MNQSGNISISIVAGVIVILLAFFYFSDLNRLSLSGNQPAYVSNNSEPSNSNQKFVKRDGYGKQTGPTTYTCDPDEISNISDSNLIGFECSSVYVDTTCTTEDNQTMKLTYSTQDGSKYLITGIISGANNQNQKTLSHVPNVSYIQGSCTPIVISKEPNVVYVRCYSGMSYVISKFDFTNSLATQVETKSCDHL